MRPMREPDPALLELRIHEAQESVQRRARQLWYEKGGEIKEREALSSAAHLLEVLRSCFAHVELQTGSTAQPKAK